jgi:hypothetical protein
MKLPNASMLQLQNHLLYQFLTLRAKRLVFFVTWSEDISLSFTPKSAHDVSICFHAVTSNRSTVLTVDDKAKILVFPVTVHEHMSSPLTPKSYHEVAKCFPAVTLKWSPVSSVDVNVEKIGVFCDRKWEHINFLDAKITPWSCQMLSRCSFEIISCIMCWCWKQKDLVLCYRKWSYTHLIED